MLKYKIIPVTSFQQNCTLFWCDQTLEAAIIDPGGDAERIIQAVEALHLNITKILLTHGHLDHVGAAEYLATMYQVPIWGPHHDDIIWLEAIPEQGQEYGLSSCNAFIPNHWLTDHEVVTIGQERLEVLHCPGHTPGHVVFYSAAARLAQVGDVLFSGSVGRTDFMYGSFSALSSSIKQKLWPLGNDIRFIPGHGPMSTFGDERRNNPFVGDHA